MAFKRELGPFDATMVVIGGIIGSGIFINPTFVARALDSPVLVLGAWLAGGCVAIAGAFAYAELARQMPRAGGQYVFLREAWHPAVGFLYGWALLLMIETGAIAAVAITFAQYALRLVGRTPDRRHAAVAVGVDRAAVGDQLLRRQGRQPRAERLGRPESRGARHPDSLRVVSDRDAGLADRRPAWMTRRPRR